MNTLCKRSGCHHPSAAHEHYRRGRECSVATCSCARLRARLTLREFLVGVRLVWELRRHLQR